MKALNAIALLATASMGGFAFGTALASQLALAGLWLPAALAILAGALAAHALRIDPKSVGPKAERIRR